MAELKYLLNAVPRTPTKLLRELHALVVRYVIHAIFYVHKVVDWVYYHDSCKVFAEKLHGDVDVMVDALREGFVKFNLGISGWRLMVFARLGTRYHDRRARA